MSAPENKDVYITRLLATVDHKYAELLSAKPVEKRWLEYTDAQTISRTVKGVFRDALQIVPPRIDAMLTTCESFLAPSALERVKLFKRVIGVSGGLVGTAIIVKTVLTAMGVGAGVASVGVVQAVKSWWSGTPAKQTPIDWIVWGITAGVAIAVVTAYFAFSGSPHKSTERYYKQLMKGCKSSIEAIWVEYGERLTTSMKKNQ